MTRAPVIMAAPDAAVRALLTRIGLQGLGAKFAAHGIDDDTLYLLDDADLREIGIGDDTRRRILAALEASADSAPEAHSELKAHEARSATRKPLRPKN